MGTIIDIPTTKKYYYRFTLSIKFVDGETEEVTCTFFGASVDSPNYLIFSDAHPDDDSDESDIPDLMVNSDNVKYLRTLKIEKVER